MTNARRFPPPWIIDEMNVWFVVTVAFSTLISVVIGGLLGLAGPLLLERRKEAVEKKRRCAEKFEEFDRCAL